MRMRALGLVLGAALAGALPVPSGAVPRIGVSPTSLAFGAVPVGTVARDTLTISNAGTTNLVLGGVLVDDPQFTAGGSGGGVPPGTIVAPAGSLRVQVAYRPSARVPATATLIISSNDPVDPELPVALGGSGAGPPTIDVSPDSVGVALVIGNTAQRTLTISNTGEAPLDWSLGVQPATTPFRDLDGIHVLWDRSKGQPGTTAWSTLAADLVARGAIVQEIAPGTTITPAVLSGGRVYMSADPSFDPSIVWTAAECTALGDWVRGGGAVLLMGDNGTTVAKFNTILSNLGTGIRVSATPGVGEVVVTGARITSHPVTSGVDRVWIGVGPRTLGTVDAPAVSLLRDTADHSVVAVQSLGVGQVAVFCDELFDDTALQEASGVSADNLLLARNTFDFLGGDLWVRPDVSSGTVTAGGAAPVVLTFDPAGLRGGAYDLHVRIASNDPVHPALTVPCHLQLTGFPEIAVVPASLSFGAVPQGESSELPVVVRNPGTEPLTVTGVTSSSPRFVAVPGAFVLAPAEAETLTVTFTPDSVGVFAGTLTLASDAATEPSLDVPVGGSGRVNCALPCAPPSLRPADVAASHGYSFWLDVALSAGPAAIRSFGFELAYDPRYLVFQDSARAEGLSAGFVVLAQANEPGRLTCGGFGTTAIPAGSSGTLLRLKFAAQCDTCATGAVSELRVEDPIEDLAQVRPCCAHFTFADCPSGDGDVNRDLVLSATDALCALKIFLNGQAPPAGSACDVEGECEASAADANCDDTVTPGDALAIYERVLCVAVPTPLPCLALTDPDPCGAARAPASALAFGPPRAAGEDAWEIPLLARGAGPRAFGLVLEVAGATWDGVAADPAAGWAAFEDGRGAGGVRRLAGLRDSAPAGAGEVGFLRVRGAGTVRVTEAVDVRFDGPSQVEFGGPPLATGLDVLGAGPAATFRLAVRVGPAGAARVDVVDVAGRRVARLAADLLPGRYEVTWDGRDDSGRAASSGIYFVRLAAADGTRVRKLALVR